MIAAIVVSSEAARSRSMADKTQEASAGAHGYDHGTVVGGAAQPGHDGLDPIVGTGHGHVPDGVRRGGVDRLPEGQPPLAAG